MNPVLIWIKMAPVQASLNHTFMLIIIFANPGQCNIILLKTVRQNY